MRSIVKGARLSSFGRQGDRTTAFGVSPGNPLPTLADQLLGERVFCFQQRPVTYSGSPPVILPPAASGNQGSSSRYCPGEGNRSARKSGKPWGGFKPSGVTRQSFRHASRSGKPVSRNDGWLHAWEGFVPRLGDNVFTQDSPSQEGLQDQRTTMKATELMKHVELKHAMIAWMPRWMQNRPGPSVVVCKHPDKGQSKDLPLWCKFTNGTPEGPYSQREAGETWIKLRMMVEAWHIACRDGVPLKDIHEALSVIPEYKELLSEDFTFSGIGKQWSDLTEDFPLTSETP